MPGVTVKEGDTLAGKYRVERVLGQGGMGIVVSALHLELEQRVAVKVLHPEMAERSDAVERFRREARAAAKIRSEHVARVIDVGVLDTGGAYMVMEYLEGNDLGEEMQERGQLPVSEAVGYVLQASEAVAEAHAVGIIHRDLKPANVFLARQSDGSRVTKVLDFGISKLIRPGSTSDPSLTSTSTVVGSPLYMSPEQMRSAKDVDTRADIWALGVILYEALAGRPPHDGESVHQICASLLNDVPAPLWQFRSDVPIELELVLMRCLAKDRNDRWPTVGELASALVTYAPPGSNVHAQRANRVLGISDSPPRAASMNDGVRHVSFPGPAGSNANPAPSAEPSTVPRVVASSNPIARPTVSVGPTLNSWGTTDPPRLGAGRRRGVWMALGASGFVLVGALLAFLFHRSPAASTPPAASVVSVPGAERGLPALQGGDRAAIGEDPAAFRTAGAGFNGTGPSATAEPSPPPGQEAVAVPVRAPASGSAPAAHAVQPKLSLPQKRDLANRTPPKADNITDFGGRR
jgi:serine/threonine-protein kinase